MRITKRQLRRVIREQKVLLHADLLKEGVITGAMAGVISSSLGSLKAIAKKLDSDEAVAAIETVKDEILKALKKTKDVVEDLPGIRHRGR